MQVPRKIVPVPYKYVKNILFSGTLTHLCLVSTKRDIGNLCCFIDLRFYGPVNLLGSVKSVSLPNHTFLWQAYSCKWVTSFCAHYFARNGQLLFLNQQKGENYLRKYFMINLHERMLQGYYPFDIFRKDVFCLAFYLK